MDFLLSDFLGTPLWFWAAFLGIVVALLVLDLGVLHRKQREIGVRESLMMSGFYIAMGLAFGAWVWIERGDTAGLDYVTGFLVEKSLAMDNVFVIAMIFGYFAVPRIYQHRVLFWGIIGVILLRGLMIGFGTALVDNFGWVLYIFAAFLIYTGIKMWTSADEEYEVGKSPILAWIRKRFRVSDELHGERFFVTKADPVTGRAVRMITPLFLALIMVEIVDVVFAVDSIPAIFAITTDPFIVYTSNVFAILGLRALYFALSAMIDRFHYLKHALAVLLVFIGSKVFVADLFGLAKFPPAVSLGLTVAILATGVVYSLRKTAPGRGTAVPSSD
ncbi:TerC family protein [Sphingosinicella sp. YJ22]|uniref:TerC family protein n=1 Tax=Sphingosinicella sp. YJ22 TaxID=1104780 RepID=UPI00140CF25C|nr:TerC family protein [Sphingosinicella sp. YJ22]